MPWAPGFRLSPVQDKLANLASCIRNAQCLSGYCYGATGSKTCRVPASKPCTDSLECLSGYYCDSTCKASAALGSLSVAMLTSSAFRSNAYDSHTLPHSPLDAGAQGPWGIVHTQLRVQERKVWHPRWHQLQVPAAGGCSVHLLCAVRRWTRLFWHV